NIFDKNGIRKFPGRIRSVPVQRGGIIHRDGGNYLYRTVVTCPTGLALNVEQKIIGQKTVNGTTMDIHFRSLGGPQTEIFPVIEHPVLVRIGPIYALNANI